MQPRFHSSAPLALGCCECSSSVQRSSFDIIKISFFLYNYIFLHINSRLDETQAREKEKKKSLIICLFFCFSAPGLRFLEFLYSIFFRKKNVVLLLWARALRLRLELETLRRLSFFYFSARALFPELFSSLFCNSTRSFDADCSG